MFVILSGSSGVGKNTVIKEAQKSNENLIMMPTFTTREKRNGEVEGRPYYYISKENFQNMIKNDEFIEHELIHGNFYGSSYKVFEKYINHGKIIIKDLGVEGAQNLSRKLSDKTDIIKIFLTVKRKKELKNRLKGRGEKQIKLRLKRFGYEQKQIRKFDYIVFNTDLTVTSSLINDIITIKRQDFLFVKPFEKYNPYKIKYFINKLNEGKLLRPAKIVVKNNNAYVISGAERLLAGMLIGKDVAKIIVNKNVDQSRFFPSIFARKQS